MSAPRQDRTGPTPARPGRYAILLAGLVLTAAFLLWRDEAAQRVALEAEVRSELTSAANAALWQINEWRQERVGDVRALSSDRAKLASLRAIIAGKGSAEEQADLRMWMETAFRALRYAHAA